MNYQKAAFFILTLLLSSTALADAKNEAQKHFKSGKDLMKLEDFSGAVVELEQSVELYPTKNGLFNLANCYKAVHRYSEALKAYARLREEFSGKMDREMTELVKNDETQIRALIGEVELRVNRSGATISVDGRQVGQSPLPEPLLLGPGEHIITATQSGYRDGEKKIEVVSGKSVFVALTLEPPVAAKAAEARQATAEPQTAEDAKTPEERAAPAEAGQADSGRRYSLAPWAWASATMALATGATAVVFWVLADGRFNDYKDAEKRYQDGVITSPYALELLKPQKDVDRYRRLAIGFGIGAGVFAVATAVLFVLDSSFDNEKARAATTFEPGRLSLRF